MAFIRAATIEDAEALARVMIDANVQAFSGLVPDQCLKWITAEESAINWRKTLGPAGMPKGDCLVVAEEDGAGIVGFAMASVLEGNAEYAAELKIIAVDPELQGQGIGRELVRRVAGHLSSHGIKSMLVRVLAVNPNRKFYERLGAVYLREEPRTWNGIVLPEAVYGWSDIDAIG